MDVYCWNLTVIGGAKTDGTPFARQLNVTSRGSAASVVVKPFPAGGLPRCQALARGSLTFETAMLFALRVNSLVVAAIRRQRRQSGAEPNHHRQHDRDRNGGTDPELVVEQVIVQQSRQK